MITLLLLTLAGVTEGPTPVNLATITPEAARALHGQRVVTTFDVNCPPQVVGRRTILGAGDPDDETDRVATIEADWKINAGDRLTVVGELVFSIRPPDLVNGVAIPARVEIWVRGKQQK